MKTFFFTTILFFSLSLFAQKPDAPRKARPNFTPEQQAELQAKKLALTLELNEKQLAQVQAIELERAKTRKANRELGDKRRIAGEKPSQEELFALRSKRLDAQTAHQNKMKKILTNEQYSTWKGMRNDNVQNKNKKNNKMKKSGDGTGPQKGNKPSKRNNQNRWN